MILEVNGKLGVTCLRDDKVYLVIDLFDDSGYMVKTDIVRPGIHGRVSRMLVAVLVALVFAESIGKRIMLQLRHNENALSINVIPRGLQFTEREILVEVRDEDVDPLISYMYDVGRSYIIAENLVAVPVELSENLISAAEVASKLT